jgi:cytochrome c-type biogenesis protein CcmF
MNILLLQNFGSNGFIGEDLIPGYIGKFFVVLMFFMAVLSTISYFISIYTKNENEKGAWHNLARISFWIHGLAILGIFSTLFFIIFNHKYEYYYAWRHSNNAMPLQYIISCFWEGQEGSFLLWMLWHFILGIILMYSSKAWEKYTMSSLGFVQIILGSMLLGIYLFGKKIGINPFVLLRDEMSNAPIFQRPEYLSMVKDGNGLNVLLQNYWMTIHPPVLFLGFASTTFPFVYAMASLFKKDYTGWVSKVLPWSVFSLSVLGTGIIMGGAWAYEALSFGGFWAWDPVENASLVPWIIGVAGLHTLLVYKNTKNGLHLSFVFNILCFVMIIYSTFLTRSGVLGESSVHSFTDEGLGWQLVAMLAIFTVPTFLFYIYHIRFMPKKNVEEEVNSREFWMFVGALVLIVSAFFITKTTSIELWNKIFDTKYSQPLDIKFHHNKIQLLFGITIAIFTAFTQYLGYKKTNYKGMNWLWGSLGVAVILTIALIFVYELLPDTKLNPNFASYYLSIGNILLLCVALFSLFANASYLLQNQRKYLLQSGGSLAHVGFAIMLVGIVISQYKQEVISTNLERIDYGKDFDAETKADNRLMFKGKSVLMKDYLVTYNKKYSEGDKTYFSVSYEKWDSKQSLELNKNREKKIDFELNPFMQRNGKAGDLVANPSTKHFWNKDVFTNVSSFNSDEGKESTAVVDTLSVGDTFYTTNSYVVLDSLVGNPKIDSIVYSPGLFGIGAYFTISDMDNNKYMAVPSYLIDVNQVNAVKNNPFYSTEAGMKIEILNIMPEQRKIAISHTDIIKPQDFIIMRAIVFPQINLIWLGAIVMVFGGLLSTLKRYIENKKLNI